MRKTVFFSFITAGGIQLLCLSSAFGGRPLSMDDAWTVEKGKFQLETGFDVARQRNQDKKYSPSLTVTYGLLDRLDFGIANEYLFVRPKEGNNECGFGDTELKAKYRLIDEKEIFPVLSLVGKIKVPTASQSKGLGNGEFGLGMNLIATKNLSKRFVAHANLGYTFTGEEGAKHEINYALGSQLILTDKWALVGEIVGTNNFNGEKDDPFSTLFGTYYLVSSNVVLDAGVGIGMNSSAPHYRITAGVTFLF